MRLYNPLNGATFDTESDDELHNAVYLDMGWLPAPDPEPGEALLIDDGRTGTAQDTG